MDSIMALKDHFGLKLSMVINSLANQKTTSLTSRCQWIFEEMGWSL